MTVDHPTIQISPESELSLALRRAAAAGRVVRVDAGDAQYDIDVHSADIAPTRPSTEEIARTVAGIRKAAGGWSGLVDADAFTAELYARRRMATRPSAES